MRFTKIPLIATLMAVALSLLIVLPGLAQTQGYDDTRGSLSSGANLKVDVLSGGTDVDTTAAVDESVSSSYFNGKLYVSNFGGRPNADPPVPAALNKVRITATTALNQVELPGADGEKDNRQAPNDANPPVLVDTDDFTTVDVNEAAYENDNVVCDALATVKNNNSGRSIKVYMADTDLAFPSALTTDGAAVKMMATFEVISSGDEKRDGVCTSNHQGTTSSDTSGSPGTAPAADGTGGSSGTGATLTDPAAEVMGKIPARHGDTLTITVAGVFGSVTLTVDAEGPDFSEIFPENNAYISSNTVKIRFLVTDSDSGLAHDGELDYSRGDTDPRAYNTDDDNNTTSEPRSEDNGQARDIDVELDGGDKSGQGSNGWRQRGARAGVSYFMDMAVTNVDGGSNPWYLEAKDRVGNMARTDADENKDGDQDFSLTVDVSSPEFRSARTGISYDPAKKKEIVDRSSIAVTFEDAGGLDAVKDVDYSKFLVEDAEVVGFVHLADKVVTEKKDDEGKVTTKCSPVDIDGNCITQTPKSRVYLQLAEPLAPDATPLVSMFGGAALDLAGNPSNQDEERARDNIAPDISVTLTSAVSDRPVIRNNGEISIGITSDEDLRRLPTVWFVHVEDGGSAADDLKAALGAERRGARVRTDTGAANAWSRTYNNGDVGGEDGLYAVIVIAEDEADNIGSTPGWGHKRSDNVPVAGREVDLEELETMGLLVEIDTDLGDPDFTLAPETDADTNKSESTNPFITIDFASEKDEYGDYVYAEDPDGADGDKEAGDKIKNFGDSHSAVAITSLTLNGEDVSGHVASVTDRKYTVGLQDLSTGKYELKVTGRDDAGNDVNDSYPFEVVARKAYEVDLIPGWNLVSVPGTPLDSSVQSVMGDTMEATIVLAYQDDAWLTSVNDSGTWRGTLTDIVGGYGYWVQTTAFEAIATLIPETDTSSVLPTAKVIAGWNLLGVVDVQQNDSGDPPSGGGDPDDYFKNIAWRVAYSFDTSNNQWSKSIPTTGSSDTDADDDNIENGKGYWVWSTEAGTLVP